jgi:hypothetical protein
MVGMQTQDKNASILDSKKNLFNSHARLDSIYNNDARIIYSNSMIFLQFNFALEMASKTHFL